LKLFLKLSTERRWVLKYAIFVMLITSLPYLFGYFTQGQTWRFTGFVFGVEDGNSYIAKMLSGYVGNWLFRSPYSPYDQRGFLGFFPYILLGKLVSNPGAHEQLVAIFHIYRWIAGIFVIFATYELIAFFIRNDSLRRWAVVLATIGGGLGWISIIGLQSIWGKRMPLEFYSPETFGFLSIYGLPHLAMARGFLLAGFLLYLQSFQDLKKSIWAGITWLILGFFQPLSIVTGWALLFTHIFILGMIEFINKKRIVLMNWKSLSIWITRALILVLLSVPFVLYNYLEFSKDPYLSQWYKQNIITSPPLFDYLLAFGVIIPFVIVGVTFILRNPDDRLLFLTGWLVSFPFLAYAPYNLQRRLPDGIWVGLIILGFIGIAGINIKYRRLIMGILTLSFIPTFIYLAIGFFATINPQTPVFISVAEASCFDFISANSQNNDLVLAGFKTSNPLPAWSPVRVVTGLGPESTNREVLDKLIFDFYQEGTSDQNRMAILKTLNIKFVILGPEEQIIGNWVPENSGYLIKIYDKQNYAVYKVDLSGGS
jgi:hypothetical protein